MDKPKPKMLSTVHMWACVKFLLYLKVFFFHSDSNTLLGEQYVDCDSSNIILDLKVLVLTVVSQRFKTILYYKPTS